MGVFILLPLLSVGTFSLLTKYMCLLASLSHCLALMHCCTFKMLFYFYLCIPCILFPSSFYLTFIIIIIKWVLFFTLLSINLLSLFLCLLSFLCEILCACKFFVVKYFEVHFLYENIIIIFCFLYYLWGHLEDIRFVTCWGV